MIGFFELLCALIALPLLCIVALMSQNIFGGDKTVNGQFALFYTAFVFQACLISYAAFRFSRRAPACSNVVGYFFTAIGISIVVLLFMTIAFLLLNISAPASHGNDVMLVFSGIVGCIFAAAAFLARSTRRALQQGAQEGRAQKSARAS